jgi:hypothetical protein
MEGQNDNTATAAANPPSSSLDNPHVDKQINAGTTAANCQPRHTREALRSESSDDGISTTLSNDSSVVSSSSRASKQQKRKEKKVEKKIQKEQTKLKKQEEKQKAKEEKEMDPRKMGYLQMAKMGYQELVNAIIRPPRAEYKVR